MITPFLTAPVGGMTKADIADMANVDRSVVTKWVARGLGFPAPVEGDLYDPTEVTAWLISTGHGKREPEKLLEESSLYTLAGLAAHYEGKFISAVTALICLRYLNDEPTRIDEDAHDALAVARILAADLDSEDELLQREIRAIPHYAGWLVSAVDDLVEAAYGCQGAFERVLARRAKLGQPAEISPILTRLIGELSGARELVHRLARPTDSIVVTDPNVMSGDLLVAIAHIIGEAANPTFVGVEEAEAQARLARRRLVVRGIPKADARISAELPGRAPNPDVIVTQLPYRPIEDRDPFAILKATDEIGLLLTDKKFAVILGPADVLADDLPAAPASERAKLLKDDMIEAIIRLPAGLVPYQPRYRTALWVLTQARASRWKGRVLTIDVSDRELTDDLVDAIADDVITWRRDGYEPRGHGRSLAVQQAVKNLVDPPRSLFGVSHGPRGERERSDAADVRITMVTQHGADLDHLAENAEAARGHVPTQLLIAADRYPATESIGRLVSEGRLIVRGGVRVNARHLTATGTHAVLGPEEVQAPAPNGSSRRLDRADFASSHPKAHFTEPGDVLVTLTQPPTAIIDFTGFSVAEYPVRILRIPESERPHLTPRVLAALLFGDGRVRGGQSLKDYRIPLLPDDEVARLDKLLAELEARRALALRELNVLDDLRQVALRGLIDGTLSLASDDK